MLIKDVWLSTFFEGDAYKYSSPFEEEILPKGFIYAKVSTEDLLLQQKLFSLDFKLMDILLQFYQEKCLEEDERKENFCRVACEADKETVLNIAKEAFVYSRFSRDPEISSLVSQQIKYEWVNNFFLGKRGTEMIVYEKENRILGFILLLDEIIDLIAVSKSFLKKGIARSMLRFANKQVGLLKAGTQIINKPSISFYQNTGFVLKESYFVFHKHNYL